MENLKRIRAWLALTALKGLDKPAVLEHLRNGAAPLEDGAGALRRCIKGFKGWDWVDREIELVAGAGARVITFADEEYPALLRETPDPPYVLYAKGNPRKPIFETAVAVVGTRRPSHYGEAVAEAISRDLAMLGVTVVSGLARGCDASAHRGCLSAGGVTVAVLGTGIDVAYPRENRRLYDEISEKGALLSELPMATPPAPFNFPKRNRIIAGISRGVLVVEAPLRSGALMTARLSLDYNREVFAVPGPVNSSRSRGANLLIKQGAALVEGVEDIALALSIAPSAPAEEERGARGVIAGEEESLILAAIGSEAIHIDAIVEKTGLPTSKAASLLTEMELAGRVVQKPGKIFLRRF